MKKSFTLVELIIVITILAILSVSAFLVVSQWIGKSRDSRRLSDLGTIQRALEVSLTENAKYPTPDSAVNITAGSIIIGQQGKFGDSATAATDIKTTPKDPLDNVAYSYYVATGGESYQVMGFLENSSTLTFRGIESQGPRSTVSDQENLQFSNSACTCNSNGTNSICSVAFFASLAFCLNYAHASEVSAADYSVRIPTVKGETLGILILSGTNQPVEELGSTVDLNTSTSNLIAVFSNTDKSSGTGGQIISPIAIKNKGISTQSTFSSLDLSLVGYWDMETLTSTGALKDWSKNGNHGVVTAGIGVGGMNGVKGKATKFDGTAKNVSAGSISNYITNNQIALSLWFNFNSMPPSTGSSSYILGGSQGVTNGGYLEVYNNGLCTYWANTIQQATVGVNNSSHKCGANAWYHIVGTFDGKAQSLYVNGVLIIRADRSGLTLSSNNTLNFVIGGLGSSFTNGLIDEVRVYNRALSTSEIQALYTATR